MGSRVLFDARLIMGRPTGIGRYVASLIPCLLEAAPDLEIHLLHRPDPWSGYGVLEWDYPNLRRHSSRIRHMSLEQQIAIPRLAKRLAVDMIHYPHMDAPVTIGSIPVVVTIHDLKWFVIQGFTGPTGWMKHAYLRAALAAVSKRAAALIADSHSTANDLNRLFGTPLDRVDVVHLAADSGFRRADEAAIRGFRERRGIERPYLISVGERRPHKNHEGLIRAWAKSAGRNTHDLVIIGQPYGDHSAPEAAAAASGLSDRVHFLADVSAEELPAAYSGADVFLLASRYEGFGLPVLEAMACDVPVIASSTTSTGEVVGSGGISIDPDDEPAWPAAIDRLLESEAERELWRDRGREWLRRFSWQRTAEATLSVWRRVLEERSPSDRAT